MKKFSDNALINYYGDHRLLDWIKYKKNGDYKCIYCAENANSREHLPSKIFLDEPFPDELSIVPSCKSCNNSFSKDEIYLACLIDFIKLKIYEYDEFPREKIRKAFSKRPSALEKFEKSLLSDQDENVFLNLDTDKVLNIILKLAIGHASYSLSSILLGKPNTLHFKFIFEMTKYEIDNFNSNAIVDKVPELGSREGQFIEIDGNGECVSTWNIVQEGQYRYLAFIAGLNSISVRIVIGEFLYAEVIWENNTSTK